MNFRTEQGQNVNLGIDMGTSDFSVVYTVERNADSVIVIKLVPEVGLEPTCLAAEDFESCRK